jgi:peptidoglycan/LPS O-acetylase OafA/YrhL
MSEPSTSGIQRWAAIEGLRAWLAWTVVVGHCVVGADLTGWLPRQWYDAAPVCVFVFVIVSGFVITHLVIEREEHFVAYLMRRWFRIFPVFAVGCLVGYATQQFYIDGLYRLSWQSSLFDVINPMVASQRAYMPWHIAAHALMVHGAIPDQILPFSTIAFLPPAWSLSLEWQFYLVAPFAIVMARKSTVLAAILLASCWVGFYLFLHGKFGAFPSGGFLLGATPLFAVGIATRLAMPALQSLRPILIAMGALALMPAASPMLVAVLFWVAFCAFLCADQQPLSGTDRAAMRLFRVVFANKVALFWGERSYSVYLMHISALSIVAYLVASASLSHVAFFSMLATGGVLLTGVISAFTYRVIERPGMSIGRVCAAIWSSRLISLRSERTT